MADTKFSSKHRNIFSHLHEQIIQGDLAPGQKLPTREELQQTFNVSSVTVQKVLDRLIHDGFLEAYRGRGTFVAPHPPHLSQYGLVFIDDAGGRIRFYKMLRDAALEYQANSNKRFRFYEGIDGHSDVEDFQRLVRDVRAHRMCSLIFFGMDPQKMAGTPVMDEPGIGRVSHMAAPGMSVVHGDVVTWYERALDYLVSRGRKRVAVVFLAGEFEELKGVIEKKISERGLYCPDYWFQEPHAQYDAVRRCVQLLFKCPASERPDGIICGGEFITDGVVGGVVASGISVPSELDIVAHCHFPIGRTEAIPVKRLGYDMRAVFRTFVEAADRNLEDHEARETIYEPVFEDELIRPVGVRPQLGI